MAWANNTHAAGTLNDAHDDELAGFGWRKADLCDDLAKVACFLRVGFLIALDEEKQTATFIETKWSNLNSLDCQRILQNLKTKAQHFQWEHKKENYVVIAKHIADKGQLTKQGHLVFDLEDFELTENNN